MSSKRYGVLNNWASTSLSRCSVMVSVGHSPWMRKCSTRSWKTEPARVDQYVLPGIRDRRWMYQDSVQPWRDFAWLCDSRMGSGIPHPASLGEVRFPLLAGRHDGVPYPGVQVLPVDPVGGRVVGGE